MYLKFGLPLCSSPIFFSEHQIQLEHNLKAPHPHLQPEIFITFFGPLFVEPVYENCYPWRFTAIVQKDIPGLIKYAARESVIHLYIHIHRYADQRIFHKQF